MPGLTLSAVAPHHRQALSTGWQLCALPPGAPLPEDGACWLDVAQPSTAAAALRQAGRWRLDEPPRRFDAEDWWWRVCFDAPTLDAGPDVPWVLGFDGLATLADVWLNGELLLSSSNMFVAHALHVGERLRPQGNELLIRCRSLDAALAERRPRPRWRAPLVEHTQLRWFRTTLLGRTPGWSPPAAPVGPWRDVWLEARPLLDLQDMRLRPRLIGSRGELQFTAGLRLDRGQVFEWARLVCERAGRLFSAPVLLDVHGCLQGQLVVEAAAPWWPHTHGEPALYATHLEILLSGQAAPVRVDLGALGFRHVAVDQQGEGFRVVVNGEPVFCRGACWTPLDVVSLRASPEALRAAVRQVREAGMNMLRLPGPMVYEEDAFYAACDAEGVMVWQEFMFANMDYPADDAAFAASVDVEVTQLLQRLQAHACLSVLCGNSEQEQQAAMWAVAPSLWEPALFHARIAGHCERLLPDVTYWPSSSHGGAFPFRPDAGTSSYYGVGAYLRPVDDARASGVRFAAECLAFTNVPPAATLARTHNDESEHPYQSRWRVAERDFHAVRDHYFERLTGMPAETLRQQDPARCLAISRWVTGQVMSDTFAQWRSRGSVCGGGLIWFLRDLRPGTGWGLLDDQGLPKAAWHLLRRSLQPVMIALVDKGLNGLDVELVNEHAHVLSATLVVDAWHGGRARVAQVNRPIELAPRSTQSLSLMAEIGGFMDLGHAYRFGPPPCELLLARLLGAQGQVLAEAMHLPKGLDMAREPSLGLQADVLPVDAGWAVHVRSERCAVGVHIEAPGYQPADDYFHLGAGEQRLVALLPEAGATHAQPLRLEVAALNTEQRCVVSGLPI